jgi:threonine dehydratase
MGTATYALELFRAAPPLDVIYVQIGLGSSICGMAAARNALGLSTEIVGVVAEQSPSYSRSFNKCQVIEVPSTTAIADGLACRRPDPQALDAILQNVPRIVEISDAEIIDSMRAYYQDTHNVAEGAGAASLAAALQEKTGLQGKRIGIVLTGGNIDREAYATVLNHASDSTRKM